MAETGAYDADTTAAAVKFKLDRDHVKGHREFNATACPGPYVFSKLDEYIARAADRVKNVR